MVAIQNKIKILVGMSGGVDSSVAAAVLVRAGYDVTGGFIKNWSDTKDLWTGECAWRGERRDAIRVAARFHIPLLTFDFEKAYRERVLERMFQEYEKGVTPNPDVLCNEEIKFGLFFEEAMKRGFDFVATGHYARVTHVRGSLAQRCAHLCTGPVAARALRTDPGVRRDREKALAAPPVRRCAHLLKAVDSAKDQSYFLYRLSQRVLQKTLFPIGQWKKSHVRTLARQWDLPTASKPDSQGICFVGKLDFHDFLRKRIPASPGDIVDSEGRALGRHDGLDAYTIGQRQGFGISRGARAWYVAGKDRMRNQLIVVPDRNDPKLFSKEARLTQVHWICPPDEHALKRGLLVEVAARYHQEPAKARLCKLSAISYQLSYHHPIWALAPGQSAVLYRGQECLGGGFFADDSLDFIP